MNKQNDMLGKENINESLSVHYLIYRIDNLQNGKHYIGQHQTQNPLDDYMGSGDLITQAIAKYGIEKFVKTILFDFDNFEEMNEKEKELVPLSACYPHDPLSYNLREGGCGGSLPGKLNPLFGKAFSDQHKKHISESLKNRKFSDEHRKHLSEATKGRESSWSKMTNETKEIVSQKLSNSLKKVEHTKEWNNNISLAHKKRTPKQKKESYKKFIKTLRNHSEEEKRQIHLNRSKGLTGRKIKDTSNMKCASQKMWSDPEKKKNMLAKRQQTYNNMPAEKLKEINKKRGSGGNKIALCKVIKILKKYNVDISKLDLSKFPIEEYKSISKDKKTLRKFFIEQWLKQNGIYVDIVNQMVWVTNGKENKKANKNNIPDGYTIGLTMNIGRAEEAD